jgi:deoxyribonuclease-4
MRTSKTASQTLEKFDKFIGFENIKLIHLNDSKGKIGCNKDLHEHIGLGHIGERGLAYVIKFAKSKDIPIVLETPSDERRGDIENIEKVKELAL